ncbi:Alpha/Beta hydrolase protein [Xylariomycetidae sp. FL2044]|nr:Alpha/Beta hydrolase protein [Xylariomycetidae sp. FL2044]
MMSLQKFGYPQLFPEVLFSGEAKGEYDTVAGHSYYKVLPPTKSCSHGILFLTDTYGHKYKTNVRLADALASAGYFVVMPDLFGGDLLTDVEHKAGATTKWMASHPPDKTDPIVCGFLNEMRGQFGVKKIGLLGHSYGARFVARAMSKHRQWYFGTIEAGFIQSPLQLLTEECVAIGGPVSFALGMEDEGRDMDQYRNELADGLKKCGQHFDITLYSGIGHYFNDRDHKHPERMRYARIAAFEQAVRWFDFNVRNMNGW